MARERHAGKIEIPGRCFRIAPEWRCLLRYLAKILPNRQHGVTDQSRVLHGGLAVLHCLAIDGIADHLDEGRDAGVFGDEAMVPALLLGSDQHQLELTLPDDAA